GIGANITGSRADVVICDDVEVPKTCDTPGKREDLRDRLDEIEYVLVPGGLKLFVGTPHARESIYAARSTDPGEAPPYLYDYKRLELALVDEDGNSRWPERFSMERIETIKRRSGPAKFASQMMLRPMSIVDGRLNPDRLVVYDANLDYREAGGEAELRLGERRLVSASCWWDPAYGAPGRGDASVIAAVFTDEDGNYRLHEVAYLNHDPNKLNEADEATQQCRQVIDFVRRLHLPKVTIESNGIGKFLPGLLRSEIAAANLPIAVDGSHSTRAKAMRIVDAFDAPMAASRLYAHASVMGSPLIEEMREWRPGAMTRDDGLDAVAGCLLAEPVRLPRRVGTKPPKRAPEWRAGSRSYAAKTDFNL
ncbi:MAG: phage terminase large subunit, partial [Rhodospirillales bacterium]|nr:phage terminase large subunit [Rhodospirillales bacterium]